MKKHEKHTALNRPGYGAFHRQEWAILGTQCGVIQKLSNAIIKKLSPEFNLAYVDADHKSADEGETVFQENVLQNGAGIEYVDKLNFHRFDTKNNLNEFQYRQWFNEQDAVLINGNHFKAKQQIVVIDSRKKDSLYRRIKNLTDVRAIIFADGEAAVFDFLKSHIQNLESIPVFNLSNENEIINWLEAQMRSGIPMLNGLVLAGGKSQRMGKDKAMLSYHGIPQTAYATGLLNGFCKEVFLSCRQDQAELYNQYQVVEDTFTGLGPFGAILSAFRENPNVAWLVMAVDLPLVDEMLIEELVSNRNPSKQATAFLNPATNFPDPLLTIWEPRSYPTLLQFLAQGYSCPRKTLINSNIELIKTSQAAKLKNVNSPEDLAAVQNYLKKVKEAE